MASGWAILSLFVAGTIFGIILTTLLASSLLPRIPTWQFLLQSLSLSDDEDSSSYHSVDSDLSDDYDSVDSYLSDDEDSSSYHSAHSNISEVKQVYRYDVFISFRGPDVRNRFVAHLFERLTRKGIFTFIDDIRIKKGKRVKAELMDAIRDSRLAIVVFSGTYPASKWCLDEMSAIADLHRQGKQIVYPVFYDITASNVGAQKGQYHVHFNSKRMSKNPKKTVDKWKADMEYLAKVEGFPMVDHSNKQETKHLEEIIGFVAKELKHKTNLITSDLIGILPRVAELEQRLKLTSNNAAVQILEIWGMSGIGKTVLANILYNRIFYQFDACCFIQDVNHTSKTDIQKEICQQLFQEDQQFLSSPDIAQKLQHRLCDTDLRTKVLIVLDDVGHPTQWNDLGIVPNKLGPGSRVVITTRFKDVLYVGNVRKSYETYEVPLLNDGEALELVRTEASKIGCPIPVHDVVRKVIESAQSLPKAIVELCSSFSKNAKVSWEDHLKSWRTYPDERYMNKLREANYADLNPAEKIIFLDIACFFGGKRKKYVEHILRKRITSDPHPFIQALRRKSLIKIRNGRIHMHQILRDLGKKIVRGYKTENPECWERLWDVEDFKNALNNSYREVNEVQAIVLDKDVSRYEIVELSQMRNLTLLILRHERISRSLTFRLQGLCYLVWHGYSYPSLSLSQWSNLVELNLPNSSIRELWKNSEFPPTIPSLKRVDLSNSKDLEITPNFQHCKELVRLDFTGCTKLNSFHESFGLLTELDYLSLQGCIKLDDLNFGSNCQLSSLRTLLLSGCINLKRTSSLECCQELTRLDLIGCTNLTEVYESIKRLTKLDHLSLPDHMNLALFNLGTNCLLSSLRTLHLSGCPSFMPTPSFECFQGLARLDLTRCTNLTSIDKSIGLLTKLCRLSLQDCTNLALLDFGTDFQLSSLRTLIISGCTSLISTPSFECCQELVKLDLTGCTKLTNVDKSIGLLAKLHHLSLQDCTNLALLDFGTNCQLSSLRTLLLSGCTSLSSTPSFESCRELVRLDLTGCTKLTEIDKSIGLLTKLDHLSLQDCTSITLLDFETNCQLSSLRTLLLSGCTSLNSTPSFASCRELVRLDLTGCTKLTQVHKSIGLLAKLDHLSFQNCTNLALLDFGNDCRLSSLRNLLLSGCTSLIKTPCFEYCRELVRLDLTGCTKLTMVHKSIGLLAKLDHLSFQNCSNLAVLDFGPVCQLSSLRTLLLSGCSSLSKTPRFGYCRELERLDLTGCTKLTEVHKSIGLLVKLVGLSLEDCTNLAHLDFGTNFQLSSLRSLILSGCTNLKKTPSFECCRKLVRLDLARCTNLTEVQISIGFLKKLDYLSLQNCTSLVRLDFGTKYRLSSLRTLILSGCTNLKHTPDLEALPNLTYLRRVENSTPLSPSVPKEDQYEEQRLRLFISGEGKSCLGAKVMAKMEWFREMEMSQKSKNWYSFWNQWLQLLDQVLAEVVGKEIPRGFNTKTGKDCKRSVIQLEDKKKLAKLSMQSSFYVSKLHINPNVKEVVEFRNREWTALALISMTGFVFTLVLIISYN
ncbi:hypothetical protein PIB30_034350 [Stylosanthes scabra]|uniref:TIR domain-containing protein n=1 Tax=Stylosanthes scabra TaxID=79078 RepID=A0ABU6VE21_9FABA|nr:hypothetical protein [Stylosanthes scabra]